MIFRQTVGRRSFSGSVHPRVPHPDRWYLLPHSQVYMVSFLFELALPKRERYLPNMGCNW